MIEELQSFSPAVVQDMGKVVLICKGNSEMFDIKL